MFKFNLNPFKWNRFKTTKVLRVDSSCPEDEYVKEKEIFI